MVKNWAKNAKNWSKSGENKKGLVFTNPSVYCDKSH